MTGQTESYREENRTPLVRYEAARAALAEARQVDEVLGVRRASEQMKLYARQAKDKTLLADATEIQLRAERKLGVMIQSAKETGQLGVGRPSRSNLERSSREEARDSLSPDFEDDAGEDDASENHSEPEAFSKTTLREAGIDPKLSSQAQKWARMGEEDFDAELERTRNRIISGGAKAVNGSRAIMASRQEAIDSLDFFPTPPWATRALVEDVLPQLGVSLADATVWEPACGEGHISGVLEEYAREVAATDIFDYSIEGRSPPGWRGPAGDFLKVPSVDFGGFDWIITNPPFEEKAIEFVDHALDHTRFGVAMFFRSQWAVEGVERYERLFRDTPPTLSAWFVERVNLCKGRWDPEGSTATAYCWLVWLKGEAPRAPFYIPPGRREARWHDGDVERFTVHPVLPLVGRSQNGSQLDDAHLSAAAVAGEGGDLDPPLSPVEVVEAITDGLTAGGVPQAAVQAVGEIVEVLVGGTVQGAGGGKAPFKSTPETDAKIKAYYRDTADEDFDLAGFAATLGATKLQVRRRANQLKLGSRDRQKAALAASNKARAAQ